MGTHLRGRRRHAHSRDHPDRAARSGGALHGHREAGARGDAGSNPRPEADRHRGTRSGYHPHARHLSGPHACADRCTHANSYPDGCPDAHTRPHQFDARPVTVTAGKPLALPVHRA